jgi:BMFP domain-containing protein YqiC
MTTTSSRFFDELAKLMTNATGAAQGLRKEVDTMVQTQVERVLNNLELVKREELDVVRDMAQKAREERRTGQARPNSKPSQSASPSIIHGNIQSPATLVATHRGGIFLNA